MAWIRVDDAISENPKVAQIDDHAFALYICGLAYCNRNLTDGFIPHLVAMGQLRWCEGNPQPAIAQLEKLKFWEKVDGGWQVHDYMEYQPSKAQVLAEREGAKKRMQRFRNISGSEDVTPLQQGNFGGSSTTPNPNPNPNPKKHTQEIVSSSKTQKNILSNEQQESFNAFWEAYPRKQARPDALKAWKKIKPSPELCGALHGAIVRFKRTPQWQDPQYIPLPASWLNNRRWEDELSDSEGSNNGTARGYSKAPAGAGGESSIYRDEAKRLGIALD